MKFFEFSPNTFQWNIKIIREQFKKVFVPLSNNKWVKEEDLPIKMDLIDSYQDIKYWKGETPFVDVLSWNTDITLGGIKPKKGVNLMVSKKVKEVLEKYRLPEHRFYPVILKNKEFKEKREDYFLFHIIVDNPMIGNDIIDYPKCTFVEITQNHEGKNEPIKYYPEETIQSSEQLLDITSGKVKLLGTYKTTYGTKELISNNRLEFDNKVFKCDYDVLWGSRGWLNISEEIKKELEAVGITNGYFFEMKENMIRPFEYEEMKSNES